VASNGNPQMMLRKCALFVFLALPVLGWAQDSPQSAELAKTIPIADVHMHIDYSAGDQPEFYLSQMDRNHVKWAGAVGAYLPNTAKVLGSRYIATLGQGEFFTVFRQSGKNGLLNINDPAFQRLFRNAENGFAAKRIKGFGELHTDNHNSGPPAIRRHIRTDNPVMRQIYTIANQYQGFVQIHAQMDGDFERDILTLSSDFPQTITILSHCLSTDRADDLRVLFKQRTNIVCELSSGGPTHKRLSLGYKPLVGNVFSANELKKDWKKLIEDYPDQVMIGSDNCCGLEKQYDELIAELRNGVLQNLPPDVMEKVAYKNAVRIFGLQ
jgi:hypothetical protein